MNRRDLLARVVKAIAALVTALVGIPVIALAVSPTRRRRGPTWQPVGRLDEFPVGEIRRALVGIVRDDWVDEPGEKAVYVWRTGPEEVVVFSRHCTDLSCPVVWDPRSERFYCPCHGGIFAKDGDPVAGPPQRPLWRYANRIRDGVVEIDLASLPPVT